MSRRAMSYASLSGPALHKFCEPKHAVLPNVAEFYNTLSSLTYVAIGVAGWVVTRHATWEICCGWAALVLVGLGSAAFHASMLYGFELCDELSMLLLVASFVAGKDGCLPQRGVCAYIAPHLRLLCVAYVCVVSIAYVRFRLYAFFVVAFALGVLAEVALDVAAAPVRRTTRACCHAGVGCIAWGYLWWQLEHVLCATHPRVWVLHSVWHVCSASAAACAIAHNYLLREERCGVAR